MTAFELGDEESQLISRIYEAALVPDRWGNVLRSIAEMCNAGQCTMFFYDAQCRARNFAVAARNKEGMIEKYLQEFIDVEAADLHKQLIDFREGEVVTPDDLIRITGKSYDQIVGDEYMQTFLPKLEFQAGIILLHDNMMCSGLGVRQFSGGAALGQNELNFLARITPHMVQAIKIHNHISSVKQVNQAIQEVLKRINQGVFLLDSELRVIFSNAEAARILEAHNALEIGHYGKLYLSKSKDNERLQHLLASLLATNDEEKAKASADFAATGANSSHPLKLTLTKIDPLTDNELCKEGVAIAVFVSDPDRPNTVSDTYMQQAYALTPTECSIMKALLKNKNITDVAELRGTTVETARGQLKIIMQKTGTHSQAELSRLLVALDGDVKISS